MRPMVVTEKHYVQRSLFTVASGGISVQNLITAVATPTTNAHVREGSRINAVYVEFWITSDDAAQGTAIVTIEKRAGGQTAMTTTNAAALNDYPNKKNVLHTQMGLVPDNVSYPMATIKGWVKIPKSKQRFGLGDVLAINFFGQSNGLQACGFITFKEQY